MIRWFRIALACVAAGLIAMPFYLLANGVPAGLLSHYAIEKALIASAVAGASAWSIRWALAVGSLTQILAYAVYAIFGFGYFDERYLIVRPISHWPALPQDLALQAIVGAFLGLVGYAAMWPVRYWLAKR